jgi:hypothetical protein
LSGDAGQLRITCAEDRLDLTFTGEAPWWLQLQTADEVKLPFTKMAEQSLSASFAGSTYKVEIPHGQLNQRGRLFDIQPAQGQITIEFGLR